MTDRIELSVDGRATSAVVARPKDGAKHGALVVVHEWHGLNESLVALTERFAADGFLAIAPDLYFGKVASDDAGAYALMQDMKTETSLAIFREAVRWARASPDGNGKVGITGFCMGGAMAFAASTRVEGLSAAAPFYGLPRADYLEPAAVRCPIQAHFARNDDFAKADRAETFRNAVVAAGGVMELFVYDGGHAFMRAGDPSHYHAPSAELAWPRVTSFLHAHLD